MLVSIILDCRILFLYSIIKLTDIYISNGSTTTTTTIIAVLIIIIIINIASAFTSRTFLCKAEH